MKKVKAILASALITLASLAAAADSFVSVDGMNLRGRDGRRITLRGTNCGNWMVQEPYMMSTSGNLDRQYKFYNMVVDVCGKDKADEWERLWMDNVFAEADMKFVADCGFNTLRVPMHYKYFTLPIQQEPVSGQNTWLTEGFSRIDQLVEWAEKYGVLLILDMHACPGGQNSGDICDYDSSKPSLWDSNANKDKLVALWRKIAERYANAKCIVGYDFINETNWTLVNNKALWDLYKRIIAAVREVDNNHIVIVEGNSYANNYTGFPSTSLDPKMMIQYHRYDVYNNADQINAAYNNGKSHNCPVFVGEFGENSNAWCTDAVRVMEESGNFAAWTQWPLKKNGASSLLHVETPAAYTNAIGKWMKGTRPTAEELWAGLTAFAQAQAFKKCVVGTDYVDALIRAPFDNSTRPFVDNRTITSRIYAAQYDLGNAEVAYHDNDYASYKYSGENAVTWQQGWCYRNDGVDVGIGNTSQTCNYYVGWTVDGEWLQYTVNNSEAPAKWKMELSYGLASGTSTIHFTANGREIIPATDLTPTGNALSWSAKTFNDIILPTGELKIRIHIDKGGVNLNYFKFYGKQTATAEELSVLEGNNDGNLLMSANCANSDGWYNATLGAINTMALTWNTTVSVPTKGRGGCLNIKTTRSASANIAVYQPVEVIAGHEYKADVAFRGTSGNSQFWVQLFMSETEPVNYADTGLVEENTIGQLNSWVDSSLATFNGMMSAKATAGSNHRDGAMHWIAPKSGKYYFILKTGTLKHPYSITLDNFSLVDLTEIGAVQEIEAPDTLPYSIENGALTLVPGAVAYNLQGVQVYGGNLPRGIYIIHANGKSYKIAL